MAIQAVNHTQKIMTTAEITACHSHVLHRVTLFTPALCHVRKGSKMLQWGERVLTVGKESLILFPAGIELKIANTPEAGKYHSDMVYLTQDILRDFRQNHVGSLAPGSWDSLSVPFDTHTRLMWDSLLQAMRNHSPHPLQVHIVQGLLLALHLAGNAGVLLRNRHDPLAEQIEQIFLTDPAREWSVDGVAQQIYVSGSSLRRRLALEDKSFRSILEGVRMGCALHSLQTTELSVGQIANESGYASASRFTARFRQRFGLVPSALRHAMRYP